MNVLSDFRTRVKEQFPAGVESEELNSLILTIRNQENEIEQLHREVQMLRNNIVKDVTGDFKSEPLTEETGTKLEKKAPAKKTAVKKTSTKKTAEKKAPAEKATAKKTATKKATKQK